MAPQYKLIYYNGMGLAEPIRLMFAYARVPYEDYRFEKDDWPTLKETLEWGKVPVLEVDGVQLGQSKAIARFVAKKHGLTGETELEQAKCDEIVDTLEDIRQETYKWLLETDEGKKAELRKKIEEDVFPRYFVKFEGMIKKNGNGLLVGKTITYADIYLMDMVEKIGIHFSGADLSKFPEIVKHSHDIFSEPGIQDWLEKRPETPF